MAGKKLARKRGGGVEVESPTSDEASERADKVLGPAELRPFIRYEKSEYDPDWVASVASGDWSAIPQPLGYSESTSLIYLIDGYKLAERLKCELSLVTQRALAYYRENGRWQEEASTLWMVLFFQHRADHFTVRFTIEEPTPELEALAEALRRALIAGNPAH